MIYVMSDLHGEYEKYIKMLELIKFSDEDELFILGDTVDRGERPIDILLDMMKRPNVYHLMGNHDLLAINILKVLATDISEDNLNTLDERLLEEISEWMLEGGEPTLKQFALLSKEQRADLIDFMSDFSLYEAIDVGDKTYILVHAGLGNFRKDKKLSEYTPDELLFSRSGSDSEYYDDKSIYIVSGHTPTIVIAGTSKIVTIGNNIKIDCGAAFGGRLGCLCLDTMEEFYI